jgi:hypothetical protein
MFNAFLFKGYFLAQWKVTKIILIPKPGKPSHPTSLLPIIFKVLEKRPLKSLIPIVGNNHQTMNWLQTKALHDRTDTSNCEMDK